MDVRTVILTAAVTLLVCAAALFLALWIAERKRRKATENQSESLMGILSHTVNAEREARVTQEFVRDGVETITQKLGAVEQILEGEAPDPAFKKTLEEELSKLMSYDVSDALSAARGRGSDLG